jgi:hypothetical protein
VSSEKSMQNGEPEEDDARMIFIQGPVHPFSAALSTEEPKKQGNILHRPKFLDHTKELNTTYICSDIFCCPHSDCTLEGYKYSGQLPLKPSENPPTERHVTRIGKVRIVDLRRQRTVAVAPDGQI